MNKKNLIWIGVGAIALYLFFRKRNSAKEVTETPKSVPFTMPPIDLKDPWINRKSLPSVNPQSKKEPPMGVPKNPYLDKTCDELKEIRNNDMVSKITPPTDKEELNSWLMDRKYKEVAYQKCTWD